MPSLDLEIKSVWLICDPTKLFGHDFQHHQVIVQSAPTPTGCHTNLTQSDCAHLELVWSCRFQRTPPLQSLVIRLCFPPVAHKAQGNIYSVLLVYCKSYYEDHRWAAGWRDTWSEIWGTQSRGACVPVGLGYIPQHSDLVTSPEALNTII